MFFNSSSLFDCYGSLHIFLLRTARRSTADQRRLYMRRDIFNDSTDICAKRWHTRLCAEESQRCGSNALIHEEKEFSICSIPPMVDQRSRQKELSMRAATWTVLSFRNSAGVSKVLRKGIVHESHMDDSTISKFKSEFMRFAKRNCPRKQQYGRFHHLKFSRSLWELGFCNSMRTSYSAIPF